MLGGGINGAAIARELVLNGVPVCLVDTADLASGATAYSSRLIHGGLRYLEFGEFDLVRESLTERTRLLRLAPQFVRPLRFFVPVENRWGGFRQSVARFAGFRRVAPARHGRGLYLVRTGLWLYDRFAHDETLPRRAVHRADDTDVPPVATRFRWLCSYSDAQIVFPERFVLALLEDARQIAAERGLSFQVLPYHTATLDRDTVVVTPSGMTLRPAAIVNATGAWVDATLQRIGVQSPRLIGGTKGSHLYSHHPGLIAALQGRAIYAEADDGRPVFLLPHGDGVLIGTTDLPFDEPPESATATEPEIEYLLGVTNSVFPDLGLRRDDIDFHYSGVRPLPYVGDGRLPASITRRHLLTRHDDATVPMWSVIGGKLTTCRSLAEETVATIFSQLGRRVEQDSRTRPLPGAESYPRDETALETEFARMAAATGLESDQVRAVWPLVGTRAEALLAGDSADVQNVVGTHLPRRFVRRVIREEWTTRLADLVERRLMLLYQEPLTSACLHDLAQQLVEAGKLRASDIAAEIASLCEYLERRYGKRVVR